MEYSIDNAKIKIKEAMTSIGAMASKTRAKNIALTKLQEAYMWLESEGKNVNS